MVKLPYRFGSHAVWQAFIVVFMLHMLQVMKVAPADLRKKLFITIRGEEALDYGGVAKLVLMLLSLDHFGRWVNVLKCHMLIFVPTVTLFT